MFVNGNANEYLISVIFAHGSVANGDQLDLMKQKQKVQINWSNIQGKGGLIKWAKSCLFQYALIRHKKYRSIEAESRPEEDWSNGKNHVSFKMFLLEARRTDQ